MKTQIEINRVEDSETVSNFLQELESNHWQHDTFHLKGDQRFTITVCIPDED